MKKLVLIDDQPYGLAQIENAIPPNKRADWEFRHFESWRKFVEEMPAQAVEVALLDFYLEPSEPDGRTMARHIDAHTVIGFSSEFAASQTIAYAAQHERANFIPVARAFAIRKLKASHNPALADLFKKIL